MRVSVIGGGTITDEETATATEVGRELGRRGHAVVCGGLGGTMEAVCRGAAAEGSETIGILPTASRADANPYVETAIATGMGHARNALVPLNGDGVIALSGGPGTLSEIGFAQAYGRPVVGLDTHELPGLETAETPAEAVTTLERAVLE
ncbi:TIGR00725 family protein [Natrononativus amylolyticus]|uniref:TIGR00725 family protein n=1 Tax=Natrononativus amylolyticus TaxID=2963434 RepID=UPI0020CBC0F3|nr:TIGR00725 family protein [Natrononativus amylolyticus]